MLVHIAMTRMQAQSVNDTGMTFCVVNNHIMTIAKYIDDAYHSLVPVIQ